MAFSIAELKYIRRYIVGNEKPDQMPNEEKFCRQQEELNTALARGGRIVGQEKNFYVLNLGEHQAALQYIVYHVGFERKPYWIHEESAAK